MPNDCRSCKNRGMDEDERQTREQLMILEALVQAMDRRDEVFQVMGRDPHIQRHL